MASTALTDTTTQYYTDYRTGYKYPNPNYVAPTAQPITPTYTTYYPPASDPVLWGETTNWPAPLPSPSYDSGTYTPSAYDAGPIPAPTYVEPTPTYVEPSVAPTYTEPSPAYPSPEAPPPAITGDLGAESSTAPLSDFGLSAESTLGGVPADLGGASPQGPGLDAPRAQSGQSPSLAALQGLIGRSSGGVQSPGLQSLLEGTAGQLGGGQARQRYGRQFQTFLANQRAAQHQRGADIAGMEDMGTSSSLQGQAPMQIALDRLRAALDLPSRTSQRSRAPQFAPSSSSLGGGLSATSPYLY